MKLLSPSFVLSLVLSMTLLQSIPANPIVAAPADAEVVPTFMAAAPANPPAHPQPDDKLASHHGGDLPSPKRDLEERALDKRWETCRNQYQCMSHIAGADYTGWYQDCANKIAVQGGDGPWFGSAGNWPSGPGCACQYTSSFNGAWGPVRQGLWDTIINVDHSCNKAYFGSICGFPGHQKAEFVFTCQ